MSSSMKAVRRPRAGAVFPVVLLSSLAFSAHVEALDVGTTAGRFTVSPSGSANYSIPITVPPGVAGMQPSISINYDSNAGNGLLGVGFSLGGLSQITRCPTTLEQDGFIDPVDFDGNDRLCLDGQRLVLKSGSYLASGTEYRTEIESFSKIISYSGGSNDPGYFKVWTKDGHEMTYGGVSNARFDMAGGSKALVWAINRIADTAGNSLEIQWQEAADSASGVPQQISYAFSTTGQPAASVVFNYISGRSDNSVAYVGGVPVKSTQLLSTITTYSFTTPVRTYSLTSTYDGSAGEARLESLQECAEQTCLPPTTFQWSNSTNYTTSQSVSGPVHYVGSTDAGVAIDVSRVQFGDFNGDGRTDSYAVNSWGNALPAEINQGQADGLFSKVYGPAHGVTGGIEAAPVDLARIRVADINADGLSDIYWIDGWSTGGRTPAILYINQGDGTFDERSGPSHYVSNNHEGALIDLARVRHGDFDGDGLLDVYVVEGWNGSFNSSIYLNRDGTSFDPRIDGPEHYVSDSPAGAGVDIGRVKYGDFNGDGITDVYVVEGWNGTARATIHLSTGPATFNTVSSGTPIHFVGGSHEGAGLDLSRVRIVDVNGDGLEDVIVINGWGSSAASEVHLSKGDGTFASRAGPMFYVGNLIRAAANDIDRIHLVDLNGDGATDIYEANRDAGAASNVWLSRHGNSGDLFVRQDGLSLPSTLDSGWTSLGSWMRERAMRTRFQQHPQRFYLRGLSRDLLDRLMGNRFGTRVNLADFNGDGSPDIYFLNGSGNSQPATIRYFQPGGDRITQITNGLGAQVAVTYKPLTDTSVHTKGSGSVYPVVEVQAPTYVVSDHETSNGPHPLRHVRHKYWGSRQHLRGRGWLGFSKVSTEDTTASQRDVRLYRQDFPYIGMPYELKHETSVSMPISLTETTYASKAIGPSVFPYAQEVVIRDWEANNAQLTKTTVATSTYGDDYGNLTDSLTEIYTGAQGSSEPYTTHNVNTYENDVPTWRLGRLTRAEVTRTRPVGVEDVALSGTRVSTFEYDPTTGLLSAETVEPGSLFEMRTDYQRYRGNVTATTLSGPDITTRTANSDFSQGYPYYGRFNTSTTTRAIANGPTHVTGRAFNPATGNATTVTDANGLSTNLTYDAFGRNGGESFSYPGVLRAAAIERLWCSQVSVCGTGDSYVMRTTSSTGAESFAVYDNLERATRSLAKDPNGSFVQSLTEYDHLGRVARKSNPHFTNASQVYWTTYEYDGVGRLLKETAPPGRITRFMYSGLTTWQWDARDNPTIQSSDVLGNVVWVQDAKGGRVERIYDAFDNLVVSTDAGGARTVIVYDTRGRKIAMQDPNMGRWVYRYNTLGELTEQTDAKGQPVRMVYDLLGRLVERAELEGTTTWAYDTLRKGALTSVEGPDYRRSYSYLPWGAVDKELISIASALPPPDVACPAPLAICGSLPPGELPPDPVGTVMEMLCAQYPDACGGSPVPTLEELVAMLCAEAPGACEEPPDCDDYPCDPPPIEPPGVDDIKDFIAEFCTSHSGVCEVPDPGDPVAEFCDRFLEVCDTQPPDPSAVINALKEFIKDPCGYLELICNIPDPRMANVIGLTEELCGQYPAVCYAQVPADPLDPAMQLLASLCNKYPDVCRTLPPPEEDPVGALLGTLCTLSPELCVAPAEPSEYLEPLRAFLEGMAANPCGQHTWGSITLSGLALCDSLPAPPLFLFASASTPPGTALFGPRVSAGLPTDSATMVQFVYTFAYDGSGRQRDVTYPSGLKVTNNFDPTNGALTKVINQSGLAYWEATNWDEWGAAFETAYGNGIKTRRDLDPQTGRLTQVLSGPTLGSDSIQNLSYGWDPVGNLSYRQDSNQDWLREDFVYDELNRVTSATLSNVPGIGTLPNLSMSYSANGNITSKSDVGDYIYGAQPHAVIAAGTAVYAYDADGNMLTGAGRSYTWASYNLPIAITNGVGTSAFLYGPERQRIRQLSSDSTSAKLIYYVGSLYEEHQHGSTIEKKHYISTPAGVVAIETWGDTFKQEYLHRDHLGSVDVITDGSGQFQQRLAYDAFGRRRGVVAGGAVQSVASPLLTARGFTGHEHLDNLDLVHMNGRVYEPLLGRFSSADPLVQAPGETQSHNRYSYVMNNPLSLTDPSGFSWWGKQVNRLGNETRRWERDFRHEIRRPNSLLGPTIQIAAVATCAAGPECVAWLPAVAAATSAAVARAQGVTDTGGLARVAFVAAWTAQASIGVQGAYPTGIGNVVGHGLVGGLSTAANGGDFGSGFLAGAFAAGAAPSLHGGVLGTIESAIVGGTASVLGGGKFANGAVTGAFSYLFSRGAQALAAERGAIGPGGTHDLLRACAGGAAGACSELSSTNQRDLAASMDYIRANHPDILARFGGDLPSISLDVSLEYWAARSGSTGFWSGNVTLSGGYDSAADLAGTLGHELLHSGDGIWGRAATNFQDNFLPTIAPRGVGLRHTEIYGISDDITRGY